LEIMVAIFIFAVVITTVFGSFRAVFSSADAVGGDVAIFESARTCLGRMATDLRGLVVSDYPRYAKPEFNDPAGSLSPGGGYDRRGRQQLRPPAICITGPP
jgi:general secretion pathway protein J